MVSGSKEMVARGVAWQGAAKWGTQLLSFGFYVGLARLLSPRIFGLVAIAWVYVGFVQVFVRQGFGDAVVQRRDLEAEHLDSAFWIAMATASGLCLLSFVLAGPIAHIFREPRVAPVIAWLSLFFPLGALGAVPTAILTRELNFRPLAISSMVAKGVGGAVGLAMAFYGWGVWSLVGQQLLGAALICIYLWLAVSWRPHFRISKRHLRDLYGFSLSLIANDILWFFSERSDQTMVGYGFGSLGLGPYSLAARVGSLLHDGIVGPFQSVAFPAFSKLRSVNFERALQKFCEMSSFVALPVFGGLAVIAPELVPCVFGSKWVSAIPILQVLAIYTAVRVVLAFVHPTMLATGRTGVYVSMNIGLAVLTFVGCLIAIHWSPVAVAFAILAALVLFGTFQLIFIPLKVLDMRLTVLPKTFVFPILSTAFMVAVVAFLRSLIIKPFGQIPTLAICILTGGAVYVLTALWLRSDLVKTIWEMARAVIFRTTSHGHPGGEPPRAMEYATNTTARP